MIISSVATRDGTTLLLRRWAVERPRSTIVIVHGVAEHSGRWGHVAEFLAEGGHEVYAYDHRGHGGSGGPRLDVDGFEVFLDDLAAVLGHVRTDQPVVLYAHSLGGLIAVAYAESTRPQPDLFVLSAPALGHGFPPALVKVARLLNRVAPGARVPVTVKPEQLSRDPSVGERFIADPLVLRASTARFGVAGLDAIAPAVAGLDRISVPTLVIHGADDTLVPTAASAPLADVDGVERRVYPGLRHEMHNEPEADEVLGFVAAWLDDRLGTIPPGTRFSRRLGG